MSFKRVSAYLLACFCFVSVSCSAPVTDFTLRDLNGQKVSLSDYKGKIVFVDFWATWCPPCKQSIPAVENLYAEYKDNKNVVILGVNMMEDPKTVSDFAEKQKISYTILMGDKKVISNYKVSGIPAFFIINGKGEVYNRYVGYAPGSETKWKEDIEKLLN